MKIIDAVKRRIEQRINDYAEANLVGRYTRLDIRFRGEFCYLDAYTEPEPLPDDWPPPGFSETREEHIERMRNTPFHLFRLKYLGNMEEWGLSFYSYAQNKYEESVLPNGSFYASPEEALETAAEFHL